MNARTRNWLASASVVALVATIPTTDAFARSPAYVGVYPGQTTATCQHTGNADEVSVAYVIVTKSIPLQEITFRAPVPDCLGGADAFVFELSPFATTGDSQNGITIDLGQCTTSPVTVLTIYYQGEASDPFDCCYWPSWDVEFVGCDGATRSGGSAVLGPQYDRPCCITEDVLGPYDPLPPDGATNVSTEVTLSWALPDSICDEVFFLGTHWIQNAFAWPGGYFTTWDPAGPLEPNTTYVWRPRLACSYDDFYFWPPLWSFTTGNGPVATEVSTWGRVKALYR